MTANLVPAGQFEQLKAQLEDTQESLGAALARIEVFRLREKALIAEIAKLRLGEQPDEAAPAADNNVAAAAAKAAAQHQPAAGQFSDQQAEAAKQQCAELPPQWPIPCYVTEVQGNLPVMLFGNVGRKTPGSVVITSDYVDFVEVRARVKRDDFMGFAATSSTHSRRSQTPSSPFAATWKQFLPSCLSPEPGSPHKSSKVAAAAATAAAAARFGSFSDSGLPATSTSATAAEYAARSAAGTAGTAAARVGSPRSPAWAHSPTAGSLSPGVNGSPTQQLRHIDSAPAHDDGAWHPLHEPSSPARDQATGIWQILWQSGGMQQRLTFEATQETREVLHKHTQRWLDSGGRHASDEQHHLAAAAAASAAAPEGAVELAVARHLVPGSHTPRLSEPSSILSSSGRDNSSSSSALDGVRHIAAALPARYSTRDWSLVYSTARHGISLQTLYRRAAGAPATVLLVRDTGGYVFGTFCTEPWRPSSRFFGTGETFVFQLEPHKVMFPWKVKSAMKNDFFMYAQQDALGVGGLGAFAIWLDAELLQGSSGSCGTFGSPCLASKEEFKVAAVELWSLVS